MAIAHDQLTLDEFLALPEEEPSLEFINGVIMQKPMPKLRHSAVQTGIARRVDDFGIPRRQARAFTELRITFAGSSRVPDIAVFGWPRIPVDESGGLAEEVQDPPDIVVEITSPDQATAILRQKCFWYVANGVGAALLVDLAEETIHLFRPQASPIALKGTDLVDFGEVLAGLDLRVETIFALMRRDV